MTTQQAIEVPEGWPGSETAYIAFTALIRAGKQPGRDFVYQPAAERGAVDFAFLNPPDLAMEVQEGMYADASGAVVRGRDILQKAQLAGSGITLIFLDSNQLRHDPDWLIAEALQYREHSWG
jgi:hypothetical protein